MIPHTPQEIAGWLVGYGHQWSKPDLNHIDAGRAAKMNGTEGDYRELVRSFQTLDANVAEMVRRYHGRELVADGDAGPATESVMAFRRCPMPDFAPPPGATFHYDDPGLQAAVEKYQEFKIATATGSGSWPAPGCDGNTPHHSIRVRIDPANMPSTIRGYHEKALAECVKAYAEIGLAVRYILDASSDCEIAKRFQGIPGGVIGWNEFPPSGTCNATIEGRLDTGYAPSNWLLWANLECHETGHGVGLEHTRGSIMNPSILLVDPMTWVGTPSYSTLKRYFGGVPIVTTTPPPPPPPPGPNPTDPLAGAEIMVNVPGYPPRRFIQPVVV